ncbi:MAG: hypothetical protein DMG72_16170 [Acidobacteria bacterium]|nr:MAG: hypothetical protein DMG72_16170 [Acidobacteriota bacterium]
MAFGSVGPEAYSDDEVRFLSLVANQLALAVDDTLHLESSELAHQELQQRNERLKLVLDISQTVASTLDLRQLCRELSSGIRRVLQCDVAMLTLPEPDNLHLRIYGLDFPEGKGFIHDDMLIPLEADKAPPVVAFRTGMPVVVDFRELEPYCPAAAPVAEGLKSGCALPLISRNRVLGTLNLARLQRDAFSKDDIDFLTQVAGQIAIAVENAIAYGEIADLKEKPVLADGDAVFELVLEQIAEFLGLCHVGCGFKRLRYCCGFKVVTAATANSENPAAGTPAVTRTGSTADSGARARQNSANNASRLTSGNTSWSAIFFN